MFNNLQYVTINCDYKSKCQDYNLFNQCVLLFSKWHATILVLYNINYGKPLSILEYIHTGSLYGTLYVFYQCDKLDVNIIGLQYFFSLHCYSKCYYADSTCN